MKSLLRMRQSAMYPNFYLTNLTNCSKNLNVYYARYEKPRKKHPLCVAKKYVDADSLSIAAIRNPVQSFTQVDQVEPVIILKNKVGNKVRYIMPA